MIVVMRPQALPEEIDAVVARIHGMGLASNVSRGAGQTVIGVVGDTRPLAPVDFLSLRGVVQCLPVRAAYKLVSRDFHPHDTIIEIGAATIGGSEVAMIAGPCAVESREQTFEVAEQLHGMGVKLFRGGAFKPRTSPYTFQGLGEDGLKILAEVREKFGMAVVTEVMATDEVELVERYADVLQIGARNVQNYRLLQAVGAQSRAVLLKRGMSTTIEELLLAAEYILDQGNSKVMLCERGIRTFERATRSTLDLNAVPVLKQMTHLPVIVDPSHATGRWDLVPAASKGAVAAGADGLIVEVHSHPELAMSDGEQSLRPERYRSLLGELQRIARAVDRTIDLSPADATAIFPGATLRQGVQVHAG